MELVKKILIADDKPENIIALEKVLSVFDIEIFKSLSGNEALALTLEHEFALALIDVQMPGMDGYETVKLMRNVEKTRYLPIIFISAIYSDEQYLIQGIESGAVDFITKPIQPRILVAKVKIFLDLFEQRKMLEFEIEQRKQTEISLRKTEEELRQANEKAIEADKLKSAFLANMSHEIRTPLNAIMGFSGLLTQDDVDDEKRKMFVDCINNSSESLAQLINDIIDIAKIEAGQLAVNYLSFDVVPMMQELLLTFNQELKRQEKEHIELNLYIPPDVTHFVLRTDEVRLRQVISNLLHNALKFTLEGRIDFGFTINTLKKPRFFVTDTGIGIPADKLNLIFDRFQQVYNEKILNQTGTGLGLSIVKKIVEMLGGTIEVTSEEEVGTSFYISMETIGETTVREAKPEPAPGYIDNGLFSGRKVLIAEDEYTNFVLLKEILIRSDITIDWAKNGQEAIDLFSASPDYHLILMDLKMPVKNGYEAFTEIRQIKSTVPIVAQTAYAMSGERDEILKFGFDAYLPKPILSVDLLKVLEQFLK
jgi:two-component system, sensor histidine kinase